MFKNTIGLAFAALAWTTVASGAENGFYLGGGGGLSSVDVDRGDVVRDAAAAGVTGRVTDLDDDDFGWQIFAGFQFNRYLGLETGYASLGEASATFVATAPTAATVSADADADAFYIAGTGSYPFAERFAAFARVGAAAWDVEGTAAATVGGATVTATADDDGVDLLFGLGLRFDARKNLSIRAGWDRFFDVGDSDVDLFSGNLIFRF